MSKGVLSFIRNNVIRLISEGNFSESYGRRCDRSRKDFRSKRTTGLSKMPLRKRKGKPTDPPRRAGLVLPLLFPFQYSSLQIQGLLPSCKVFADTFTRLQTLAAPNFFFFFLAFKFLTKIPGPLGKPFSLPLMSFLTNPSLPTRVS